MYGGYFCDCGTGYGGAHCENITDFCQHCDRTNYQCENVLEVNGCVHVLDFDVCSNSQPGTHFECNCRPGFEGDRCETSSFDLLVDVMKQCIKSLYFSRHQRVRFFSV